MGFVNSKYSYGIPTGSTATTPGPALTLHVQAGSRLHRVTTTQGAAQPTQSGALGRKTTNPSMPHATPSGGNRPRPRVPGEQVAASAPGELRSRKSRAGAGGPLAQAAMAVATVAALLAALGGALWLAARRFVGPTVQRLHGGGNSSLMHGKTVLITGANSGLGRATAAELLRLGARVIMGCRDRARAEEAAGQLRRELREAGGPEPGSDAGEAGELVVKELDLASLRSVRAFCQEMLQVWVSQSLCRSGRERDSADAGGGAGG